MCQVQPKYFKDILTGKDFLSTNIEVFAANICKLKKIPSILVVFLVYFINVAGRFDPSCTICQSDDQRLNKMMSKIKR